MVSGSGVVSSMSVGSASVPNQKEILDGKTEKSKVMKRKLKEGNNLLVKSNEKQGGVTIDLTSDNDDELEEFQKSNSSSTSLCPVSQAPDKEIKRTLKSLKKKRCDFNTGDTSVTKGQNIECMNGNDNISEKKNIQRDLSSDESVSNIDHGLIWFDNIK